MFRYFIRKSDNAQKSPFKFVNHSPKSVTPIFLLFNPDRIIKDLKTPLFFYIRTVFQSPRAQIFLLSNTAGEPHVLRQFRDRARPKRPARNRRAIYFRQIADVGFRFRHGFVENTVVDFFRQARPGLARAPPAEFARSLPRILR